MAGRMRRRAMRQNPMQNRRRTRRLIGYRRNPVSPATMKEFENAFRKNQVSVSLEKVTATFEDLFSVEQMDRVTDRLKVEASNALVDRLAVVGLALNAGDSDKAITTMVRMAQAIKTEEEAKAFMTQVDSVLAGEGLKEPTSQEPEQSTSKPKPSKKSKSEKKVKPSPKPSKTSESESDSSSGTGSFFEPGKNVDTSADPDTPDETGGGAASALFQQAAEEPRAADQKRVASTRSRSTQPYSLSNSELIRLAIYRRSDVRQRDTYGRYFLFLQFGERTKPIPSIDVWLKAIEEGREDLGAQISSSRLLELVFDNLDYSNKYLRQNMFILYRPYRKGMPSQLYIPSLNAVYSNDGKNRIVFPPAAEFISRTDIVPGSTLPSDLKKAYLGYTDDERNLPQTIGQVGSPESIMSYWQLASAVGAQQGIGIDGLGNWRKRREKYQAYGTFIFMEDERGKINLARYYPSPRPSLAYSDSMDVELDAEVLNRLPNPRRRRRRITTKRRR